MTALDPKGLLPQVDWQTRQAFLQLARAFRQQTGLGLLVRSARRSCAEQADLYGIGRTYNLASAPVTYAQGCQSWHVVGRAIDADPVNLATGKVQASCELATIAGKLWEGQGGVWGGRFGGFGGCGDQGHFEWHGGVKLSQACPAGLSCEQASARVQTQDPPGWGWAVGGFALVGLAGWAILR